MTSEVFIQAIISRLIINDNKLYLELLNSNENKKDDVWRDFSKIFQKLTDEDKETLAKFIELIQINTVSHFLGVVDGVSYLNEDREEFVLSCKDSNAVINGDLQDIFLAEIEDNY